MDDGRVPSMNFGNANTGIQVKYANAPIQANFHYPPEPTPVPHASIPVRRDSGFVDRADILDQITQQCLEPAGRVAISGLGGVGKSQLAVEFAYRLAARSTETWVFWVRASSQALFLQDFVSIANKLKLIGRNLQDEDILQLVFDWLSSTSNGKWFLVLDSADDSDVLFHSIRGDDKARILADYLPQSPNGSILITTRNEGLAFRLVGSTKAIHRIGPMTTNEALMLLEKRLGHFEDITVATELVQALDLIPLAISQTAAYIQRRKPRVSLSQYLTDFQKSENKRVRLLSHDSGDPRRDLRQDGAASNPILTTWQVSFKHIRSRQPSATNLLALMSFFNPQGIPESLLRDRNSPHSAAQPVDPTGITDSDSGSSGDETEDNFEDDVEMLRDYCLITQSVEVRHFQTHGLVQLATRTWLEEQGLQDKFLEQFTTIMASAFPNGESGNWKVCEELFPHVEAAAQYRPRTDKIKTVMSGLLLNGASYARRRDMFLAAEQMALKSKRYRERLLGEDDEATLESINCLASIYWKQGRWAEAEDLMIQLIQTCKTKLGEDHDDTLASMSNLAEVYNRQDRWKEAGKLSVQVVETRKTKLGKDHKNTLNSMITLSCTYKRQGRWQEAEKLDEHVLEVRRETLEVDDPKTLVAMNSLASTYRGLRRLEDAEKLVREVVEMSQVKFGADHSNTLTTKANLSTTYREMGRYEEAERLDVQVMETRERIFGADHHTTLNSKSDLAATYRRRGRFEEAEKYDRAVLEVRERILGPQHSKTLTSMSNLGVTYQRQGKLRRAEELLVQAVQGLEKQLGADHTLTRGSRRHLANTLELQGRQEEALSIRNGGIDQKGK